MKALVTMEERKAYWRHEEWCKRMKATFGSGWLELYMENAPQKVLDYLLKMHQIRTLMWMEQHPRKETSEAVQR